MYSFNVNTNFCYRLLALRFQSVWIYRTNLCACVPYPGGHFIFIYFSQFPVNHIKLNFVYSNYDRLSARRFQMTNVERGIIAKYNSLCMSNSSSWHMEFKLHHLCLSNIHTQMHSFDDNRIFWINEERSKKNV